MTITITPPGGTATTLCHGDTRTLGQAAGPDALQYRRAPGLRERRYISDTGPRYEHTGIDSITGSFNVTIICDSASAAATLASSIISSTPAIGTYTDGNITLYDCAIQSATTQQTGRAIRASYTFTGSLTQQA